jgi:AraC family transcriptional regulator, exoenzyme S synthesis regulatory protein ExsA
MGLLFFSKSIPAAINRCFLKVHCICWEVQNVIWRWNFIHDPGELLCSREKLKLVEQIGVSNVSYPAHYHLNQDIRMVFDIYHYFKDDPKSKKLIGSDYLFAEYQCPIEKEQFQFMSELNFITYVVSGRKDWISSGKIFETKAGEALFIRKGVYTTRQYFDADHCLLTFFISDDFIRNFMRENNSLTSLAGKETVSDQIFPLDVNDSLKALFHSIFNYLNMGTGVPRSLVELKFNELLFNIVLDPKNKKLAQFFTSLNQANKLNFDHVMMKNFQFDLELEEFARLCGRSLSTFKRDFKNYYQQTPGKWLSDRRLEYARTLLISSDLNVNEVCYESGFRNSSHFNKAFKERYQVPPKKFRLLSKNS